MTGNREHMTFIVALIVKCETIKVLLPKCVTTGYIVDTHGLTNRYSTK